jgi:hypothetical protein
MQQHKLIGTALCTGVLALWGSHASGEEFSGRLSGFQELGALNNQTGAVLSNGTGTVELDLDRNAQMIHYKLIYSDVGTTQPQTRHGVAGAYPFRQGARFGRRNGVLLH